VTVFDSRPRAWDITGRVAHEPEAHGQLKSWLRAQLGEADAVVVKDPRIGWFLPLWMGCSAELAVHHSNLMMLRHPAEILASARAWYGTWQTDASRATAWLNVMLETERATRGTRRVFVRYEDLLADWRGGVGRIGEVLDLPQLSRLDHERLAQVGEFVDPTLRRSQVGWEQLAVPAAVRDMADGVWEQLQRLAEPDGDVAELHAQLDASRAAYVAFYEDAEAIAQSSVTAVKPRKSGRRRARPQTLRVRLARRVPERYRKRLRRATRALRRSG